jgi:hypothetical protein
LKVDDAKIAATILALIAARAESATICPSDAARSLAPGDEAAWRALMPEVRRVADDLQARGLIRVTARSHDVGAQDAHGPIRLGRPRAGPAAD